MATAALNRASFVKPGLTPSIAPSAKPDAENALPTPAGAYQSLASDRQQPTLVRCRGYRRRLKRCVR